MVLVDFALLTRGLQSFQLPRAAPACRFSDTQLLNN